MSARLPTFIACDPPTSPPSTPLRAKRSTKRSPIRIKSPEKRPAIEPPITPPDLLLVSLCREGEWEQVLDRCVTHPHEASPRLLQQTTYRDDVGLPFKRDRRSQGSPESPARAFSYSCPVYEETALGIVCSADIEDSEMKLGVIKALLRASPDQLAVSQKVKGNTPLRDLIQNQTCEESHLRAMLEADETFEAVSRLDVTSLAPIDHLVMRLHLNPNEKACNLVKCYFEVVESQSALLTLKISPLIRLLSLSTCQGLRPGGDEETVNMIIDCTKYLLEKNPSRIQDRSKTTECTVLHVALRNFGNQLPLIQLFLGMDETLPLLSIRNVFGDLPLHVACAGGAPMDVLKLVIRKSLEAVPMPTDGPHPLLWTTNFAGFTPIDLEWMRHIEGGGGLHECRIFYPLEERGLRYHSPRQETMYRRILRKAVNQVMDGKRDTCFFGALMDRIIFMVQMAHNGKDAMENTLLHAASSLASESGPSLPEELLFLFHWMHPEQCKVVDERGRLPLHYALINIIKSGDSSDNEIAMRESKYSRWIDTLIEAFPEGTRKADAELRLPLHYALESGHTDAIDKLIQRNPESLERRDPLTGLYPFQQVNDVSSSFKLLRLSPSLATSNLIIN